jgi:hypothetical protein
VPGSVLPRQPLDPNPVLLLALRDDPKGIIRQCPLQRERIDSLRTKPLVEPRPAKSRSWFKSPTVYIEYVVMAHDTDWTLTVVHMEDL